MSCTCFSDKSGMRDSSIKFELITYTKIKFHTNTDRNINKSYHAVNNITWYKNNLKACR